MQKKCNIMVKFTHPKIKVIYLKTLIYKGLNKITKVCYITTKNVLHNVLHNQYVILKQHQHLLKKAYITKVL